MRHTGVSADDPNIVSLQSSIDELDAEFLDTWFYLGLDDDDHASETQE